MRKYISTFYSAPADLNYTVELWDLDDNGEDVEMTMGVPPVTIDWPEVEPYEPLMTSGCTLKYITNGVYTQLMANGYRDIKVVIYSHWWDEEEQETKSLIVWSGWLTPNIYSQPYDHDREELELTAIDELSCLQYISYRQFVNERGLTGNVYVRSMFDVIINILRKYCLYATSDIRDEEFIREIWLTNAVKLGTNSAQNALRELYVNEQLFIDEDMSCKEAIEACLHYVNETGFMQYGIFEVIDRDNINDSGLTLYKYPISNPAQYTTDAVSFLVTDFDNYFQNTLSTCPVYNDISYMAKFGEFPSWQSYKKQTTLDASDIIALIAGTTNQHYELGTWPTTLVNDNTYVTRARLASCPDNVVLYAYPSNEINTPVDPYPTFDDYYDVIQQAAIPGTSDYDAQLAAYSMLATYVNLEETRDKDSINNTGVSNNDYIALFVNNIYNRSWVTQFTPKKLAEIKYNSNLISINRGYLDISGAVRFENLARRIPNTDHSAKIEGYNNKTTELLMIRMSVKIGDYYYNPGGVQEWVSANDAPNGLSLVVPLTSNKGEEYFADHTIAKTFANIDINNDGFLVDLSNLPEIYGDITVGFYTYIQNDNTQTSGKAKYDEISTIFINDLDIKYINYPLVTGDVEYYNSSSDGSYSYLIEQNTFKDDNVISTFIDNQQINTAENRIACQHPPCNNMALVKISGHYVPASLLYYMKDITSSSPAQHTFIPEDYSAYTRYNQYSTGTLKFELLHRNEYDMDVQLKFNGSSSQFRYYIAGASIDYYENLTRYTLIQKK